MAELLGCPRDAQPEDWPAFRRYWHDTVAGLEVSDTARHLARSIFAPDLPWIAGPPIALARFLTVGTLPPAHPGPVRLPLAHLGPPRPRRRHRGRPPARPPGPRARSATSPRRC